MVNKAALFCTFCCCLLLAFDINAQRINISGTIKDKTDSQPIMFANMVIYSANDTTKIIKGTTSDDIGNFAFKKVKKQNLILKITYLGYEPLKLEIKLSEQKGEELNLGDIFMSVSSKELGAVNITAQQKRFTIDVDKLSMNIDENLAATVSNGFELLKKVPGVSIDKNEKLTLNGKSGVSFQYNGRDLKLDWSAVADMLKGMAPQQIEKFDLLTNPGVKYDAEGTAGIINIKMKDNKNYGLNGSIHSNANYQSALGLGAGGRLNYVNDKWTISLGAGINRWTSHSSGHNEQYQSIKEGDTTLFQSRNTYNWNNTHNNVNFSASYLVDTLNTIGMSFYYSQSFSPWVNNHTPSLMSHWPNYYSQIDSSYLNTNSNKNNNNYLNMEVDWTRKLDTLNSKISTEIDFSLRTSTYKSLIDNIYYNGNIGGDKTRQDGTHTLSDRGSHALSARVDWVKNFANHSRIEAGAKTLFSFDDKDFSSLSSNDGVHYINDNDRSNHFKYFENINSAYLSYAHKFFKKLDVRAGVRLEQTNNRGHEYLTDTVNTKSYFNVFPNVRLSYAFKDDNVLSLSSSYRISRPGSNSRNPFFSKESEYSYSTGNPTINPQYSYGFSLSHSWKYMLFTSLSYSHTTDNISYLNFLMNDTTGKYNPLAILSKPINLGSTDNVDMELSFNKDLFAWWSVNASASATYNHVKSDSNLLERENWFYNLNAGFDFNLPYNWRINIYYYYASGSSWGLSTSSAYQDIDVSVGKNFLNNKLALNFGVGNFLNNSKNYDETKYKGVISKSWYSYEGLSFNISLRWNFGNFYKNKQVSKVQTESFDDRASGQKSSK